MKSRRSPMRRWFSIEVAAYILVFLALVTAGWANNQVSGIVALGVWALAGCALALAARGIYRRGR